MLNDILKSNIHFGDETRFQIIPMHSTLSPKDQKRAFIKTKEGCRKIILATNIAETSITIADCVFGKFFHLKITIVTYTHTKNTD